MKKKPAETPAAPDAKSDPPPAASSTPAAQPDPPKRKRAPKAKSGRPRKPDKGRIYARNMQELGEMVMPPRDRKIIQRAARKSGCPGRTADGRYDIKRWEKHINRHFDARTAVPEKEDFQIELLKQQAIRAKLDNDIRQGTVIDVEECCHVVGDMFAAAKDALLNAKNNLAPQVVGLAPGEASKRIGEEIRAALEKLAVPDTAKKKVFWQTVSERLSVLLQQLLLGVGASSTS